MNWIKIDKNTKAPEEEVLAINEQNDLLVGWLSKNKNDWECEDPYIILEDVVAYIPTRELIYSFKHNGGL